MPYNANSSAAEPSRYFTVRGVRALGRLLRRTGRFICSRRMIWTLAIGASLVVVFYQYENWNGARELAAAREKMLARIGTENIMDILPLEVPENDNFMASQLFQSWRGPAPYSDSKVTLTFPGDYLIPAGVHLPELVFGPGRASLDWSAWPDPQAEVDKPDQTRAAAFLRGLPGIMDRIKPLASQLYRRQSQLLPCRRQFIAAAGGEISRAEIFPSKGLGQFHNQLIVLLLASAEAGDGAAVRDLSGIMLKLVQAFLGDAEIIAMVIGLNLQPRTLLVLNEGLTCQTLTESDLTQISGWLQEHNDIEDVERLCKAETLRISQVFTQAGQAARNGDLERFIGNRRDPFYWGPSGWLDCNGARALEWQLQQTGGGGPESWRSAWEGANAVSSRMSGTGFPHRLNPRQALAWVNLANMAPEWQRSAQNLFHRRCAILTCALHRHRLKNGVFPASLTELEPSLLPGPLVDPARTDAPLNYQQTENGFLLWSVGLDRVDDQGDPEKDWIWRHEPIARN